MGSEVFWIRSYWMWRAMLAHTHSLHISIDVILFHISSWILYLPAPNSLFFSFLSLAAAVGVIMWYSSASDNKHNRLHRTQHSMVATCVKCIRNCVKSNNLHWMRWIKATENWMVSKAKRTHTQHSISLIRRERAHIGKREITDQNRLRFSNTKQWKASE